MKFAKFGIIGMDTDTPDHELAPGFFRSIWNIIPKNGFSKTAAQNIKGTEVKTNGDLPAGTNTCIGSFTDKTTNRVYYFYHNSNNDHSIWYFDPTTDAHTLVLMTEFLNFSLSYPVVSCDFIGDIMQWADNNNEIGSILVSRAVDQDLYDFTDQDSFEKQCRLYKVAPIVPPTVADRSVGTSGANNISADSYQFCTQYVFHDDSCSDISPLSKLSPADTFPSADIVTNQYNRIAVTQQVDPDIKNTIKAIYFILVKNSVGDFYLFREVESTGATSYTVNFEGTDTVEVIQASAVNFIPRKSKNVIIHDQRSIVTMDEYDYDDIGSFTLTVGKTSRAGSSKICCPNSSYSVSVICFDKFGRTPGPTQEKTVSFGSIKKTKGTYSISTTEQLHISWSLSGTPPSWASSYAICIKKNNTFSNYYKGVAMVMFYLKDASDTDDTFQIRDYDKIYGGKAPATWAKSLHWKLPNNVPFFPDSTYKLRLISDLGQTYDVENIIGTHEDKIITKNFGLTNWATILGGASGPYGLMNIALERSKTEPEQNYYEIGQHFDCSGGTFTAASGTAAGEFFYLDSKFSFTQVQAGNFEYGSTYADAMQPSSNNNILELPVITSSPTHASVSIQNVTSTIRKASRSEFLDDLHLVVGAVATAFGYGATNETKLSLTKNLADDAAVEERRTDITDVKLVYTPDLSKSCSDFGRPWAVVRNKRINQEPTLLSISDTFISGSNINGINKFRNLYSLPTTRTPISKLVNVDHSNIFLAIHERTTTSLATYAGGNILHTSDGSQIVGDGKTIIGYERELTGGYGTIYPDSVVSYGGRAWWFDPYKGEVCRYSNNGISPIGSVYKMHNFFKTKGNQFIDTTGRNVISGYDANLDILYMTFRSDDSSEEVTVAFVDRQGEERWLCFNDFVPDRYAVINERLFSFLDGEMWEHNVNNTYNLFYGQQYTTSLNHKFNLEFDKPKLLANVSTVSNSRWDVDPILTSNFEFGDQETRLAKSNFVNKQGRLYADVKRDVNTPAGMLPSGKTGLVAGRRVVGEVFDITLENDSTELMELNAIEYGYKAEGGYRG